MAERDSTLLKPTRASLLKQMPGEPSSRVAGLHVSRTLQSSRVELCWVGVWYRCMGPGQLHTASPRVRTRGVARSVSVDRAGWRVQFGCVDILWILERHPDASKRPRGALTAGISVSRRMHDTHSALSPLVNVSQHAVSHVRVPTVRMCQQFTWFAIHLRQGSPLCSGGVLRYIDANPVLGV